MLIKDRIELLVAEMLDGKILLSEAIAEFEKIYIQKALERNGQHLSKTAQALGVHRNTLSNRVASYASKPKPAKRRVKKVVK